MAFGRGGQRARGAEVRHIAPGCGSFPEGLDELRARGHVQHGRHAEAKGVVEIRRDPCVGVGVDEAWQ